MRYGSVCSGIEAATAAWEPLGWEAAFFSEIEAFPRAVLGHHYPDVPLHGDFTTIREGEYDAIDLLVGGTPCQSFSVAGLRGGLGDARGNLALEYLALAARLKPRWIVWENVPGVLSSNQGRDFGAFLGGLVECGYGFAYRVLDAQYFGLAQRRKRVFVVGCLGDWRRAAAVLFEQDSLSWDCAPRRQEGQRAAPTIASRATAGGGLGTDFDCDGRLIAVQGVALRGRDGGATAELTGDIATALRSSQGGGDKAHVLAGTLQSYSGRNQVDQDYIAFNGRMDPVPGEINGALDCDPSTQCVATEMAVRRLTPRECERLQGFPDDYTLVPYRGKPAADGPRYRALGNSMAVPCMAWIGQRIDLVEGIMQ